MDFVYFQQHDEKDWIRIGWTGNEKGRRELQQDEFELVAMLQGTGDDESHLHAWFRKLDRQARRKVDRSTYNGPEIFNYVTWLLERNHAGRNRREAESMPRLPWAVWSPDSQRNEGRNGELNLFGTLPPRDRLSYARSDLAQLSTEGDDWFTPDWIITKARQTMGSIDTDPATSSIANRTIQAAHWYTKDQDGLRTDLPWTGNVWLNPPYGRGDSEAAAFVNRLLSELKTGNVTQAITILNLLSISTQWFEVIWPVANVHLVFLGRPQFWNPERNGDSPATGRILTYFGPYPDRFQHEFAGCGHFITEVPSLTPAPAE